MPCKPEVLKLVPLFALLDDEELGVLAGQVEERRFEARRRIYRMGEPAGQAYVVVTGRVVVTTVDEDHQEVVFSEPAEGEMFGFASMIDETPHQTTATAKEDTLCIEIDRHDISVLLQSKPMAGMDLLAVLGRQIHAAQELVRGRAVRNPNEVIAEETTFGERIADGMARFGGSWSFIISFLVILILYTAANVYLGKGAWDPYPFILLNLFLSMLAAIQAPVIMMSQNRQDEKDRLRSELDFEVNKRAESEIQGLSRRLLVLTEKVDDLHDLIRPTAPQSR
jgi:uncharacterized membrane protein